MASPVLLRPSRHLWLLIWLAGLLAAMGGQGAMAKPAKANPDWLSCPDTAVFDPRPGAAKGPKQVREIAPLSGAKTSDALAAPARLTALAYAMYGAFDNDQDPRKLFDQPGLTLVGLIYGSPGPQTERRADAAKSRTLYGFVADDKASTKRYIVFRGTQQPAEWVRNLQAGQRPYPIGVKARDAKASVHAGFLSIFESLELESDGKVSSLRPALPQLTNAHTTIIVGHSLGSALATLTGVEAAWRAPKDAASVQILTLASPRVGDAGFAVMAKAVGRIDRVCNLVDVVTAVPPSTPRVSYVHVGTPFRVSSFDWPQLANDLPRDGDQILCWHGDASYHLMLQPGATNTVPAQCLKPPN